MKKLLAVLIVFAAALVVSASASATSTVPTTGSAMGTTGIAVASPDMDEGLRPATTHSLPALAIDKPKIKHEIQPIDRPIRIEPPRPLDTPAATTPK